MTTFTIRPTGDVNQDTDIVRLMDSGLFTHTQNNRSGRYPGYRLRDGTGFSGAQLKGRLACSAPRTDQMCQELWRRDTVLLSG